MNRTEYMIQKYEMYIKMWKKDLENASKNLAEDLEKGDVEFISSKTSTIEKCKVQINLAEDFIREIKALEEEQQ